MKSSNTKAARATRRRVLAGSLGVAGAAVLGATIMPQPTSALATEPRNPQPAATKMSSGFVKTSDGTEIFYKDSHMILPS